MDKLNEQMMVLGFSEYRKPAERLAEALNATYANVELHTFPDGESRVQLPASLPATVIICRSLNQPNDKLVELMLSAATARALGATRLILVAPYLCYQRQDIAFNPGEAISQQVIGHWIARYFDELITVDPHLHRVHSLDEVIPARRCVALTAATLMAPFLRRTLNNPLLVGPDAESEQWVASIAQAEGFDYVVASKRRDDDRTVLVTLPEMDCAGRDVVLVDDMISSGATAIEAGQQLLAAGAESVHCLVTHALLDDASEERLFNSGIRHIWSSDAITHASNVIQLAPLLAEAVRG